MRGCEDRARSEDRRKKIAFEVRFIKGDSRETGETKIDKKRE